MQEEEEEGNGKF